MLSLDQIVEKLEEIVGRRFVSTNPIDKINYQHTLAYGAYRALPDVIVRVESDARGNHSVAKILQFANEHKIPIVAKGGVGMGISSPLKGGILLDMLGMDKILEVNPTLQYVIAEGGASVYAIHHALRQHGLMLPNFVTYGPAVVIGAMVNKGGIGYGMTRYGWIADMVLGLEVILANGETLRLGALANQKLPLVPFRNGSTCLICWVYSLWRRFHGNYQQRFVCGLSRDGGNGCMITATHFAAMSSTGCKLL
jgi:FAD/FMN-containing dehydrogenase